MQSAAPAAEVGPEAKPEPAAVPSAESAFVDSDLMPVGDSPVLDNPNAPVTIVAFASLQCPFSAKASVTLHELVQRHPDEVRVVFKHFPLVFQQQSRAAAQAAAAAGQQGRFWEMHDVLMANQRAFEDADMLELTAGYARELGLDEDAFRRDFGRKALLDAIERDAKLAASLGARGTPVFFINGNRLLGAQPIEEFKKLIDAELEAAKK